MNRPLLMIALLLLLSGCQQWGRPVANPPDSTPVDLTPAATDLQHLIDFSNRFKAHDRKQQLALCEEMRMTLKGKEDPWIGWNLATAISQVEGCGEPAEAIALINQMLERRFVSTEASWLAYYQLLLLKRQQAQHQQLQEATAVDKRQQKRLLQLTEENQSLERKLQELKTIETSINERLDEKQRATN